jgi:flagellar biosynthesis/type III secretory pathway chaperone
MNEVDLKKELSNIEKELRRLDNVLEKQENEGIYEGDIYDQIDKLTEKRDSIQNQIDSLYR